MQSYSVVEESFNIAWGFLAKSGELGDAEKSTVFLVRFIREQMRAGESRPMMIANRAIDAYRSRALQPVPVERGQIVWIA
jgi:hypothetical protein